MVFTCSTFLVQSGEVPFWGQKKFTQVDTVYTGLPPDGLPTHQSLRQNSTRIDPAADDNDVICPAGSVLDPPQTK